MRRRGASSLYANSTSSCYPPATDSKDEQELLLQLEFGFSRMLNPEETCRSQQWIDWLDEVIDRLNHAKTPFHKRALHKLRYLCGRSGRPPQACHLLNDDITVDNYFPPSQGGFSDVYRGSYLGTSVALKTLRVHVDDRQGVEKAFAQEVAVWKHLNHPNITPFLGTCTLFPFCIVSKWMPHGSIRSYISIHSDVDRIPWLIDIVRGLAYMHEVGVVHGDLKSANILINEKTSAVLSDFGLTTVMSHTSGFTTKASIKGSLRWMAPEMFGVDDDDDTDVCQPTTQSDVYSLAMVYWEIICNQLPFHQIRNDFVVMAKILKGQRPSRQDYFNSAVNRVVWDTISRCWHQDPYHRPPANEVLTELLEASLPPHVAIPPNMHPNTSLTLKSSATVTSLSTSSSTDKLSTKRRDPICETSDLEPSSAGYMFVCPPSTLHGYRQTLEPGWTIPPHVLIVDDDQISLSLSTEFLHMFGCTIDVAVDGIGAVNKMSLGNYDLVLMEIIIPKLDGVTATSMIRQVDLSTPIIFMTSATRPDDIMNYIDHGMNDILPKPFSKKGLLDMLEKHLSHLKVIREKEVSR